MLMYSAVVCGGVTEVVLDLNESTGLLTSHLSQVIYAHRPLVQLVLCHIFNYCTNTGQN